MVAQVTATLGMPDPGRRQGGRGTARRGAPTPDVLSGEGGMSRSTSRLVSHGPSATGPCPSSLAWVALTAGLNLLLPQVEIVGEHNAVSMSPQDAPSVIAKRDRRNLPGVHLRQPQRWWCCWGRQARPPQPGTYDTLIDRFRRDTEHPACARLLGRPDHRKAGVQSSDWQSRFVQLNLAATSGSTGRATSR